jgi:hypothetical protein
MDQSNELLRNRGGGTDWKWIAGVAIPITIAALVQWGAYQSQMGATQEAFKGFVSRLDAQSGRMLALDARLTETENHVNSVQLNAMKESAEVQRIILTKLDEEGRVRSQRSQIVDDRLADIAISLSALAEKTNALADLVGRITLRDRELQREQGRAEPQSFQLRRSRADRF